MKKSLQKLMLAAIIGSFALVTGCAQSDNTMNNQKKMEQKKNGNGYSSSRGNGGGC